MNSNKSRSANQGSILASRFLLALLLRPRLIRFAAVNPTTGTLNL
jgi:hypothetical protein